MGVQVPLPAPTSSRTSLSSRRRFFSKKRHCPSVLLSPHSLSVVMLCKTFQPQLVLHFVQAPHRVHARFGCPPRSVALGVLIVVRLPHSVAVLCQYAQLLLALHFVQVPTGHTLSSVASHLKAGFEAGGRGMNGRGML